LNDEDVSGSKYLREFSRNHLLFIYI
jgi:hypothetical protein